MPSPLKSPRARSLAFWAAGLALAVAGLVSSAVEDLSFGHVHLVGGHVVHHYHFYLEPHEHSSLHPLAEPDDDHDDDHDLDHPHDQDHHHPGAPHPHGHPAQRTATVSTAPAQLQPVAFWAPAAPEVLAAPVAPTPAVSSPARPVGPPSRPRAPPALSTSRDLPS